MKKLVYKKIVCGTLAASTMLISSIGAASAQSYYNYGPGAVTRYLNQQAQQQRQYARQQQRAAQEAAARERTPHEAPYMYQGQLTPITNVQSYVSGRTFYLEAPIVANHQIQRMETNDLYMAADGKSYSAAWSGRRWMTERNNVCLDSIIPQNCWRLFQDDAHQVYFVTPTSMILHVARIENGDAANTKGQFAQAKRQKEANDRVAAAGLMLLLGAMASGGGSDGGNQNGCDASCLTAQYQHDGVGAYALPGH